MLITTIQAIIPNLTSKVNQRSKGKMSRSDPSPATSNIIISHKETKLFLMEQIQTHDDGKTYVCHNDLNQGQTKGLGWPCNTASRDLLRIYTRGKTQHQPGQATGQLKAITRHQVKHTKGQTPVQGQNAYT